jgi:selenocysteine-specific elongation factor
MRRLILGTAGHIDHGKTALIKALTGIDTDRLREEKDRGISIDLGFAHLDLDGETTLGIVDVPGHERFIKNMLAGVGGIDLVLFVVACDEGIMPQTREHFDIVSLLGVKHAVFALTKSDLVDAEMTDIVRDEVEDLLKSTPYEGSPVVPTSTKTGRGLEEIRETLEQAVSRIQERQMGEAARLPVDRVFTMTGRGTVVTGTLWSGTISKEDRLVILPGAVPVRVRSAEVHGHDVETAFAGQRTALGIHGVEKQDVGRGDCLVSPEDFEASRMIDVEFDLLKTAAKPLKHRARIRFHLGASEVMGRILLLGSEVLTPGEKAFAQIRLEAPVVAGFGDRFVIRSYSPMRTIGGGLVLNPLAKRHKRGDEQVLDWLRLLATGDMTGIVEGYIERSTSGIGLQVLRPRLNCGPIEVEARIKDLVGKEKVYEPAPGIFLHAGALKRFEERIVSILESYQAKRRLTWGMPKEELRERLGSMEMAIFNWVLGRLEVEGRIFTRKGSVRAGTGDVKLSADDERARSLIIGLLKGNLFQPPTERDIEAKGGIPADTLRKVIRLLVEDGEVVRLEPGLVMHAAAVDEAGSRITNHLTEHGEATASELKSLLGTTRKYAVPLLEHLDRLGITRRNTNGTRSLLKR